MFIESFKVESPNVKYTEDEIHSLYNYDTTELVHEEKDGAFQWVVKPKTVKYEFKTQTCVPKLGVMLVGWGGNNGSTLTAGVIANRDLVNLHLSNHGGKEREAPFPAMEREAGSGLWLGVRKSCMVSGGWVADFLHSPPSDHPRSILTWWPTVAKPNSISSWPSEVKSRWTTIRSQALVEMLPVMAEEVDRFGSGEAGMGKDELAGVVDSSCGSEGKRR